VTFSLRFSVSLLSLSSCVSLLGVSHVPGAERPTPCSPALSKIVPLSYVPSLRLAPEGQLSDFIDGLGPGQLVGRQVLGASALGDIQLSMCYQKGFLEVEVIRARGLQAKSGSKVLPGN
jgi:hypothetical protein